MRSSSLLNGKVAVLIFLVLSLGGCATKVGRVDSGEVKDLSGLWNDTDSQAVAKEMMDDVLNRPWIGRFNDNKKRMPVVIVGEVRNLSHEHINYSTFTQELQRNMLNSDKVEFAASSSERGEVSSERGDQDINATEDTRKAMGKETGADFMLKGTINTIIDASGREQVRFYQVNLTLISLADNKIVWNGEKKIKKFVTKPMFRF
jgi:uncharacterized protein (TIGR02722 family)